MWHEHEADQEAERTKRALKLQNRLGPDSPALFYRLDYLRMRVPSKDPWLAFPEDVSRHLRPGAGRGDRQAAPGSVVGSEKDRAGPPKAGRHPVQLASFVLPPVSRQAERVHGALGRETLILRATNPKTKYPAVTNYKVRNPSLFCFREARQAGRPLQLRATDPNTKTFQHKV